MAQDIHNYRAFAQHVFPQHASETTWLRPHLQISARTCEGIGQRIFEDTRCNINERYLLVCPGARNAIRQYPLPKLAEAVKSTISDTPIQVILGGGPGDRDAAGALRQIWGDTVKAHDLTGVISLQEHLGLVSTARAVLCMETSHAHIAGALGVPAVVIYGGGHDGLFGPWGVSDKFRWLTNRVPCFGCHWRCVHERPICIEDLSPHDISSNLLKVMGI